MNKIGIIFKREYLIRISKKTFILSTFLIPLMITLLFVMLVYFSFTSTSKQKVAVNDVSGIFSENLISDTTRVEFDYKTAVNSSNFTKLGYAAVLMIPAWDETRKDTIRLISEKQLDLITEEYIRIQLNLAVQKLLFVKKKFDKKAVDSILESSVSTFFVFNAYQQKKGKIEESHFWLSYGIGFTSGLLIYITVLLYGTMVMRGVVEEKTNRIAEIMVSSVKPFELMLGKITGIAAVGLTQFLLWILLIGLLTFAASNLLPHESLHQIQHLSQNIGSDQVNKDPSVGLAIRGIIQLLASSNWPLILFCFIFYFTGGYLFYASLFAAVGSVASDDAQEAGTMALPIMLPIIFSFVMMTILIYFPGSSLSIWTSIIPFSSPIIMMSRIPFGVPGTVPWWQLGLSMVLLVAGFLCTTWLAGKIYRTGILLYGKKAGWKEMWKWAFRRS